MLPIIVQISRDVPKSMCVLSIDLEFELIITKSRNGYFPSISIKKKN